MSATRDSSQKIGFIYSNLYQLYKKGQKAAKEADVNTDAEPRPFSARGLTTSGLKTGAHVLRAEDRHDIKPYQPQVFASSRRMIPERKPMPAFLHQARQKQADEGMQDLKKSLQSLQEVHGKLKFILNELDELLASKK